MRWPTFFRWLGSLLVLVHYGDAKRGFILTVPGTLRGGTTEKLNLKLFEVGAPGVVTVQLTTTDDKDVLVTNEISVAGDGTTSIPLSIPATSNYNARLKVNGTFETEDKYTIKGQEDLNLIVQKPVIVFVQTDKPIYKPGQTVKFRILPVDSDLKPIGKDAVGQVKVENPVGSRIAQWNNVTFTQGMTQLEMPLSEEPPLGQWTITVNFKDVEQKQYFTVEEYVLPKFEVTITPPPYILVSDPIITYEICGRYTYGKLVEGKVNVTASYERYSWSSDKLPTLQYVGDIEGCYKYDVNVSLLQSDHGYYSYRNIIVTAEITETGTGIKQNKSYSTTSRESYPLKLQFVETANNKNYKAGLPYYGKLSVSTPDDKPAENRLIELCYSASMERGLTNMDPPRMHWWATRKSSICKNYTSDSSGVINFIIPPQRIYTVSLSFTAKSMDFRRDVKDETLRGNVYQPQTTKSVKPWYSPSGSFLQIQPINEELECGQSHSIKILYTASASSSYKLYYQMKSRGTTVGEGTHEYSFDPNDDITLQTDDTYLVGEEMVEVPPVVDDGFGATEPVPITADPRYIGETGFELSTNPFMSPTVRLLVYYIRDDGEVVSDSVNVKITKCLAHKVSMEFGQKRQQPGTDTSFKLTADPVSVCGVGIVDKSVHLLKSDNQLTKDKVLNILAGLDTGSYYSYKDLCDRPTPSPLSDRIIIGRPWNSYSPYDDSITAFQDAGYAVLSDLTLVTRPCRRRVSYPVYSSYAGGGGFAAPSAFDISAGAPQAENFPAVPFVNRKDSGTTPVVTKSAVDIRTYFPETWLWEVYNIGEDGELNVKSTLPHTITEWVGSAVCLNSDSGLGVSDYATITAYQDFFLSFSLPYSIIRGETVPLTVSVFNYVTECLPVELSLDVTDDFELVRGSPTVQICVCGGKSYTHRFVIKPTTLGQVNFTVQSKSIQEEEVCGNQLTSSIVARDAVTRSLLVEPEGFPKEETTNAFICSKDFVDGKFTTTMPLAVPENVVPDSARAFFYVSGDLMGPAIEGLDGLVRQPTGCGEQNMVLFVPNIFVMDYLKSTDRLTDELEKKALRHMMEGYQRELKYRHDADGSYSAFGNSDPEGSIWLSAFVMKAFSQAKRYIDVDEGDLTRTINWIISKQEVDGCFPEVGKVLHSAMKGGLSSTKGSQGPLTAYILISLLESSYSNSTTIKGAMSCIKSEKNPSPYTLALFAYAAALNSDPSAAEYWDELKKQAIQTAGVMYWQNEKTQGAQSSDVETAAYVVLTLMQLGGEDHVSEAFPIVRWIAQQRNSKGGFISTQDTVVALQALSKYATYISKEIPDMTVDMKVSDEESSTFKVDNDNRFLVQSTKALPVPSELEVEATGSGCAVLQTVLRYSVQSVELSRAFELNVTTKRGVFGDCKTSAIAACFRYLPEGRKSNMAVLEVKMVSGYAPNKESLQKLTEGPTSLVKRQEVDNNIVNLYFDEATNDKICVKFEVTQETEVEDLKPGIARVYDYYAEEKTESTEYTISSECPKAEQGD